MSLFIADTHSDDFYDDEITAFVEDAEEYHAALLTKPNHYCSMWESKE